MSTKIREQLNTQLNVEEAVKEDSSKLITRERIGESPIWKIGQKGKWFGIIGDTRVTDVFDTEAELEEEIYGIPWKTVANVIAVITEKVLNGIVRKETEDMMEDFKKRLTTDPEKEQE